MFLVYVVDDQKYTCGICTPDVMWKLPSLGVPANDPCQVKYYKRNYFVYLELYKCGGKE